jgi:DinB superfamily
MTRSQLTDLPAYFDRYIHKTDDVDVLTALQTSVTELENAPIEKWKALGDRTYAEGKWTVKDILQHLIDTERVFAYRATAFARGDKDVKPFDEEMYAKNANATQRSLEDLLEESIHLRKSTIYLYQSFSQEMLDRKGNGIKGEYSVHAMGYIFAGHQRWHFGVLEERYFPMLDSSKG